MRKIIFAIIAVALTAHLGVAQHGNGGQRMSPEERQKMMQERYAKRDADLRRALELSDAAALKVDSVNHAYDKEQKELMKPENRGGGREVMRSKMEAIQKSREAGVKAQLNEEQIKKYNRWLEGERARRPSFDGRGGNRGSQQ